MPTLVSELDQMTVEGTLYDKLPDGSVRCYACGHRCLIRPGRRGICKVRFNEDGVLKVPWGYVAALQADPIEKKPFFHVLPGSDALTFGMLGCDFHCGYCFPGETMVMTDRGPLPLAEAFGLAGRVDVQPDGEIGYSIGLRAVAASGKLRAVRAVFKHPYQGNLISIQPYYLPELRCTPDHRVYATDDPGSPPRLLPARDLTRKHYLAIPAQYPLSDYPPRMIRPAEALCDHQVTYRVYWKLSHAERELIRASSAQGVSSREIGRSLDKSASYIRHVRSKLARGGGQDSYNSGPLVEEDTLRFPNEHRPGIPLEIPLELFDAPPAVVRAFLAAYIAGDGHRYPNGKVSSTTISRQLAYGLGWLALQIGYFPSIYATAMEEDGQVQNRKVKRGPFQYTVVWYEQTIQNRKIIQTEANYLIPLRGVSSQEYHGDVYNMEVEEEHSYLANFCAVSNCQNWLTSQALRDPQSDSALRLVEPVTPQQMLRIAQRSGARVVASSYNEPLITTEWAVSVFQEAQKAGLRCVYISNGNLTPEALELLRPYLSAYKIDLKTMQDKHYRSLGGVLNNVLDGIRMAHESRLWVEVVTLIIPGFNDSSEELWDAARFLASVSVDIPWHVTAFHPDYKMTDPDPTSAATLERAAEIGQEAGLHFVYAGNLPGQVSSLEDTFCPKCGARLIHRYGYTILEYRITAQGACPQCGTLIPGVWPDRPEAVRLRGPGLPRWIT